MGRILDAGRIYEGIAGTLTFYTTGTTTLKATFSDSALSVQNANPLTVDADGRISEEVFGFGPYTVLHKDVNGAVLWSEDDVNPFPQGPQTLTDAGAVTLTELITLVVTTTASALTLADGSEGQEKHIVMITDAGAATLTPTSFANGTTIVFDDAGDSIHLLFTSGSWHDQGGSATVTGRAETAITFTSADATPTVGVGHTFITAGTTAITDFDDGVVGQTIKILGASSITVTHGSPISLSGSVNFDMVSGDSLTLHMFNDQVWEEIARTTADAKYESVTTFTNTLIAAENGTTYFLNLAGGGSTVLPAPALGLNFEFIVATAPTTAYTIDTNGGDNIMHGTHLDIVGELVYGTARDIMSFVANTSLVGDRCRVVCDGVSWFYEASSGADGGITTGQT